MDIKHIKVEDYFDQFPDFGNPTSVSFPLLNALSFDVVGVTEGDVNRCRQPGGNWEYYPPDIHPNMTRFVVKYGQRLRHLRLDVSRITYDLTYDAGESVRLRLTMQCC